MRERGGSGVVTEGFAVRYLTPRECFRLMGQRDEDIDRIMDAEPSRTAQYRFAGNSIVVDVLAEIFRGIYMEDAFDEPRPRQTSLEGWK